MFGSLESIRFTLRGNDPTRIIFNDTNTENGASFFASQICEEAMRKGVLLVHTGRESIKIGPPLTIPEDALGEGLDVLDEILQECTK